MRTLDDIVPPSKRGSSGDLELSTPPRRRGRFPAITLGIVVVIILACVGALFYFSSAEVDVTPTTSVVTASGLYTAAAGAGDLPFQVVTAQKVGTQSVVASGTKVVTSSAQGKLTIYNTDTTPQKLRATTRFQTQGGLVFKIPTTVTVPAAKGSTPGSITVSVVAAETGSNYNIGPSSFTLPGLSGTSQYTQVTAKSTSAMTGGASGNQPVVSADAESAARKALITALGPDLESAIVAQVPTGYILLPGGATTTYQALPSTLSAESGKADIKEQGTISAVVFPASALAKIIAKSSLGGAYQNEPVSFLDSSALTLKPSGAFPNSGDQSFSFSLSGTAKVVYTIDAARIAGAVAGKGRQSANDALTSYPEVKRAILILRPFWRSSFPEDPASIKVVTEKPVD